MNIPGNYVIKVSGEIIIGTHNSCYKGYSSSIWHTNKYHDYYFHCAYCGRVHLFGKLLPPPMIFRSTCVMCGRNNHIQNPVSWIKSKSLSTFFLQPNHKLFPFIVQNAVKYWLYFVQEKVWNQLLPFVALHVSQSQLFIKPNKITSILTNSLCESSL